MVVVTAEAEEMAGSVLRRFRGGISSSPVSTKREVEGTGDGGGGGAMRSSTTAIDFRLGLCDADEA